MKHRLFTTAVIALCAVVLSCERRGKEEPQEQVLPLIEQASADLSSQRFDAAMENALKALELSQGHPLLQVKSLHCIVGIDIMANRDADAWKNALEAESIARKHGFSKELAEILISKAKLCSYAEISPETGRNDEGLTYAREALRLAEEADAVEQQCEAYYIIGSLYINKNRWNDPIDPEIYRTAGEYLGRGQDLADKNDLPRLRRNGILFRSRWLQQGGSNEKAIEFFEQMLSGLKEGDHLTAASLEDRLVNLYTRVGDSEKALDAHEGYVLHMENYIRQKQDETLQEMETRFQVQEKEHQLEQRGYQIIVLLLTVMLLAAIVIIAVNSLRRIRRRNAELQRISETKEQIIDIISKDLRSPANGYASKLEELAANPGTMNEQVAAYVEEAMGVRARRIADFGLSQREIQIIRLSAEGLSAAQIAERLFLSVHTVNTHRQRIYSKMGVKNVTEMLHKADDMGLL